MLKKYIVNTVRVNRLVIFLKLRYFTNGEANPQSRFYFKKSHDSVRKNYESIIDYCQAFLISAAHKIPIGVNCHTNNGAIPNQIV